MGSKEEDVPKEPVERIVFVEDMNESELATAVSIFSYQNLVAVGLILFCMF